MRRPAGIRWIAGQPLVTLVVVLVSLFALYVCVAAPGGWLLAIVPVVTLWWVVNANSDVAEYKAWRRAWEGMGPDSAPRRVARSAFKWVAWLLIVGSVAWYLYANRDLPEYRLALLWMGAVAAIAMLAALVQLARRARGGVRKAKPGASVEPVSICVDRPIIKVPDLRRAYAALPAHCRQVLDGGRGSGG